MTRTATQLPDRTQLTILLTDTSWTQCSLVELCSKAFNSPRQADEREGRSTNFYIHFLPSQHYQRDSSRQRSWKQQELRPLTAAFNSTTAFRTVQNYSVELNCPSFESSERVVLRGIEG